MWLLLIIGIAFVWLMYETNWLRVQLVYGLPEYKPITAKLTKAQLKQSLAENYAWDNCLSAINYADGNFEVLDFCVEDYLSVVEQEIGLRSMPYHGRHKALMPGWDSNQLEVMRQVYSGMKPYQGGVYEHLRDV